MEVQGAVSAAAAGEEGVGASNDANQWQWLMATSTVLFLSALVAGLFPLAFIKVRWMNKVTAVGAGLCIGASLALMLPESFHLLFEAHEKYGFNPGVGGLFLTLGVISFLLLEAFVYKDHPDGAGHGHAHGSCNYGSNCDESIALSDGHVHGGGGGGDKDKRSDCSDCKDSLLPEHSLSHSHSHSQAGGGLGSGGAMLRHRSRGFKGWTTVAFMVLHACTDGLVLGSVAGAYKTHTHTHSLYFHAPRSEINSLSPSLSLALSFGERSQ